MALTSSSSFMIFLIRARGNSWFLKSLLTSCLMSPTTFCQKPSSRAWASELSPAPSPSTPNELSCDMALPRRHTKSTHSTSAVMFETFTSWRVRFASSEKEAATAVGARPILRLAGLEMTNRIEEGGQRTKPIASLPMSALSLSRLHFVHATRRGTASSRPTLEEVCVPKDYADEQLLQKSSYLLFLVKTRIRKTFFNKKHDFS